eukprot:8592_1
MLKIPPSPIQSNGWNESYESDESKDIDEDDLNAGIQELYDNDSANEDEQENQSRNEPNLNSNNPFPFSVSNVNNTNNNNNWNKIVDITNGNLNKINPLESTDTFYTILNEE